MTQIARRAAYALAALVFLAGCGAAQKPPPLSTWTSANPAAKTVVLTLRASGERSSLGAFNGYSRGQVLVVVPRGWRVAVRCLNTASTARHSCAIVKNSLSTRPAFPGAETPALLTGLTAGSSASFSFIADRPGAYRIASLVDNDEIAGGMWDVLQVGGTRRPSVRLLRSVP